MSRRYDLPFSADGSARFLPWIVAAMVFLATLTAAGMLSARSAVERWQWSLGGSLTVQIPPRVGQDEAAFQAQVAAAAGVLNETAGIARARVLDPAEAAALVAPWLGGPELGLALPLPAMIDASLDRTARLDANGLRQRLKAAAPDALIDDHGDWLVELRRLSTLVDVVGLGVLALVGLTAVASVAFATRSGLAVHREVVAIMHVVGATDAYIARQFQRHAVGMALRGGIPGFLSALIALGGLSVTLEGWEAVIPGPDWMLPAPPLGLTVAALAGLLAVPVAMVLTVLVTARLATTRALARLP